MKAIKETSERSKQTNKAQQKINSFSNMVQIEFEGFSVKENRLTGLFDRLCITEGDLSELTEDRILNALMKTEINLEYKKLIAEKAEVDWYYVFYEYNNQTSLVYNITKGAIDGIYNSFLELGLWISNFSDQINLSRYEESGLPKIDKIMRENKYSWPGNLDGLLFDKQTKDIICIIEYQNTSKKTVAEHDNNDFMYSTPYRKGDSRRWKVIKIISDTIKSKIMVIVWSNNESVVAIKNIKSFVLDQLTNVSQIIWGRKTIIELEKLNSDSFLESIE